MRPALLLALVALACLAGAASTDTTDRYIPNTRVSYRLNINGRTDVNTSFVFIDEAATDHTYVEFSCQDSVPSFYLHVDAPVLTQRAYNLSRPPSLTYRVDAQQPHTLPTLTVKQSNDPQNDSHLHFLAVPDERDPELLTAFLGAQQQVSLRLDPVPNASGGPRLSLTFPVKGFPQAVLAVRSCK